MRAVDLTFAEMLTEVLDAKINKSRREMFDTYIPIEVERLQAHNGVSMGSSTDTGYNYRE